MDAIGEYGGIRLDETRAIQSVFDGYTYFRDGDVLVAKITPCFENGKGAIAAGLEKGVGFGTTELHVLRPLDGVDSRFLFYITISKPFRDAGTAAMIGAAGQKRVPEEFIQNFRVAVPALTDQRAIADFLDEKTAAIDALIAKKERLIELIEEKRQATITRAVTKGIDPDVPMKDSGVEWLGRIPIHWRAERIKWVAQLESGHTPDRKIVEYWDNGTIPWVSLKDTKALAANDYITETAEYTTDAGVANSSARILPARSVVFTRDATVGLAAITTRPMAVSQHLIAWVCGPEILPEFLLYVIRSMGYELERLTWGATIKTIGMTDVKALMTPVPPLEEQQVIVDYLATKLQAIDDAKSAIGLQIMSLREYRQTLISAAVTGQLDVRSRVARALDPTAPEPLEEVLT